MFREIRNHFLQPVDENSSIDWTGGYIFTEVRVRLPRIVNDRSSTDYGSPDTESSLTRARERARREAVEDASLHLMQVLLQLRLDSSFTVRQKMERDGAFRERMGDVSSLFLTRSRHTGDGYVSVELAIPFRGEKGLYSRLYDEGRSQGNIPEMDPEGVSDPITGIIIDVSEYPDFNPSLQPRIFTDQGRMIFGPGIVSRRYAVYRGMAAYYSNGDRARSDRRLGNAPFYTFASGVTGRGKSDIFLDSEDASRILNGPQGREALRRCAVVFIVASRPKQ